MGVLGWAESYCRSWLHLELMLKENYLSSVLNSDLVLKGKSGGWNRLHNLHDFISPPFCLSSFTLIQISQMSVILSPLFL